MDSTPPKGGISGTEAQSNEAAKLEQHLSLLREECKKLQIHANSLESRIALLACSDTKENTFLSNLSGLVSSLHDSTLYSDMNIRLVDRQVAVHKIVFAARSSEWGVSSLADTVSLDWTKIQKEVALALIKWVYTDQVELPQPDDFMLSLMGSASSFNLTDLVKRCEKALIASANVKNCVRYYSTADEIGARDLKDHCSSLISAYWDDFTSEDFFQMSAPLLYTMFKSKTKYPLHSAIRLKREDVVFLYLVENGAELAVSLNTVDSEGELPLEVALKLRQVSIATTLLKNGADLDCRDTANWPLLHRAIARSDEIVAKFLLEHGASVSLTTPDMEDTALHMIATYSPDCTPEETITAMLDVAKLLLEKGLDANIQNKKGFTALHLCVMARNEQVFLLLMKHHGLIHPLDMNLRTNVGHTPLWYALIQTTGRDVYNRNSFAARLVEAGANPNPIYPGDMDSLLHLVAEEGLEEAGLFVCSQIKNINHINLMGESALHIACKKDLARLVKRLLEYGANPNVQTTSPENEVNIDGLPDQPAARSPLHVAIEHQSVSAVKAFLKHKATAGENKDAVVADVNLRDSEGSTPLSMALAYNLQAIVPDLIQGGADINMRDTSCCSLLHQAIMRKDSDTAIFLLNHGANIGVTTVGNETELQLAIEHRLPQVVEALCHRGINMAVRDKENRCPLWAALVTDQEDIASILVQHGVDTDSWSDGPGGCLQTLLHKAINENNESAARFLIQSGCDLNATRKVGPGGRGGEEAHDGQTPLHLCCQRGLESVVQALLKRCVSCVSKAINVQDAEGKTPLHTAVICMIQNRHNGIINLLLCHPSLDLTIRDKSGLTPFATALNCKNNMAAQAMRDKMPQVAEQFDARENNFLHTAILKGDVETVMFLLGIKVDVHSRVRNSSNRSPLHLACLVGNETIVRNLILAGARIHDRDGFRQTALHIAARAGHENVICALIHNSAEVDALDNDGDNALHVAMQYGQMGAVRALLTESKINAVCSNLKERTPLHVLANFAQDNAAQICDFLFECVPGYPINEGDCSGNTALLIAYTKGHDALCRSLVKAGACINSMNKEGVTIFNHQVTSNPKTLLKRLLDMLSQEPLWVEGDMCLECGTKFGLMMPKHHCRHCGRLLCSKCLDAEMPILKFKLHKPVRVCEVCFEVLHFGVP